MELVSGRDNMTTNEKRVLEDGGTEIELYRGMQIEWLSELRM